MKLFACIMYLGAAGILAHFLGESLPRGWFESGSFPYRCMAWEKRGAVYERLGVRRWKDKMPDMSRIMPNMLPKRLRAKGRAGEADDLIRETCVAELTHVMLCIAGLGCMWLWPGPGGAAAAAVWALGNLPYIIIQRYNRPRLARLSARLGRQVAKRKGDALGEGVNIDLQYGRGA